MRRADVERLDATRTYWVPSVVAPCRDWAGAPGCRTGARFLVDRHSLCANRDHFAAFDTRLSCLRWILRHRSGIRTGRSVRPRPTTEGMASRERG